MKEIKGVCPIIAAPFTNDGEIDYKSFENLTNHLVKCGANGLALFGVASEFHKLTDEERYKMAEIFINIIKPTEVYSVLSVTDHSTEVAVKRAKHYEKLGADCLMLLPPFFLNPSIEAIKEHMIAVLEAVDIPVIIQYAPGETKLKIEPKELIEIYDKYPNVKFKIEENPPVSYIQKVLKERPEATVMVGYAGLYMLDVLDIDGKGVMPGCSFSEIYVAIYKYYQSGDHKKARELHNHLLEYIKLWMQDCEYIIQVEKTILYERNIIDTEFSRRPTYKIKQKDREIIAEFLKDFSKYLGRVE